MYVCGSPARSFLVLALALVTLAVPALSFAQVSLPPGPPYTTLSATGNSASVRVGDMNGDGNNDVVIGRYENQNIQIVLGNGQGGFGTPIESPAFPSSLAARPRGVVIGDINGDGNLDVVALDYATSGAASVLFGDGAGNLGSPTVRNFYDTRNPGDTRYVVWSAALGDVNGDGKPDLIVGAANNFFTSKGDVWVALNDGSGNFGTPAIVWTRTMGHGDVPAQFVATGDLDGDGNGDIAVTSGFGQFGSGNAVTVLYGNGTGAFSPAVGRPFPLTPNGRANQAQGVVIAEMNGVGLPDLVVPASDIGGTRTGGVTLFRSTGSRTFDAGTTYPTPFFRDGMAAVGDLSGDGRSDVVVTGASSGDSLAYLLNDGSGGLGGPVYVPGLAAIGLAMGDLTNSGPGTLDIVVGTGGAGTKLLQNGPAGSPAQMFFTDALTGPSSPNLATIPAGKYGYTPSGLQRTQSSSTTDRPMVTTALGTYLTALNFTAEITVNLSSPDLAYFGFGRADPDPINYFNEPTGNFLFRIHRNWGGTSGIQVWPTQFVPVFNDPSHFFGFADGGGLGNYGSGPLTFMIQRAGDSLTMSIPSLNVSHTFSISQYAAAMGLNNTNARIFFGNTSTGSVFSDLKIYEAVPDTTAPVISGFADIVAEATGPGGAQVTFTPSAEDDVDGPVNVVADPASDSLFPIGDTTVELSATDAAGNSATASFTVTVQDTIAPAITSLPADQTAEATSAAGAVVTYAAATATDVVGVEMIIYSHASGTTFPLGVTTVTVTAMDAAGNATSAQFVVTVRDTTAPALGNVTPSQATLWQPNHQMVAIDVTAVATDAVGVISLRIINVTSSEPDNGLGDGDTGGDIVITGPLSVNLRAERSGRGNGRTYTITVEARDAAGNASTKTCTIVVPKSKGR